MGSYQEGLYQTSLLLKDFLLGCFQLMLCCTPLAASTVKTFGVFTQVRSNLQRCYQGAGAHHGSSKNLSRCQLSILKLGFLVVQQNPILRQRWYSSSVKILGRLWGSELKPLKIWATTRGNLSHGNFFSQQQNFESKSIWVNPLYHSRKVSLASYFTAFKSCFNLV